jgi:hypothetical protein
VKDRVLSLARREVKDRVLSLARREVKDRVLSLARREVKDRAVSLARTEVKDKALSLARNLRIHPGVHLRDSHKCSKLSRNNCTILCLLQVMKGGHVMLSDNSDISRAHKKIGLAGTRLVFAVGQVSCWRAMRFVIVNRMYN